MDQQLHTNFILELFKLCFNKKEIIETCKVNLKYQYLSTEEEKIILREIIKYYDQENSYPTIGYMFQEFSTLKKDVNEERIRKDVLTFLQKVHSTPIPSQRTVVKGLQEYLFKAKFTNDIEFIVDKWNKGKREEALTKYKKTIKELDKMNLVEDLYKGIEVFGGWQDRFKRREENATSSVPRAPKIPYGIMELDQLSYGGSKLGDVDCVLARSGSGKTRYLIYRSYENARLGHKVLHLQYEDNKENLGDRYDAAWTGIPSHILEALEYTPEQLKIIKQAALEIKENGGEVTFISHEDLGDTNSIVEVRNQIVKYKEHYGYYPHLVSIDYLELLDPTPVTGIKYTPGEERHRRLAIADILKLYADEFKVVISTATQTDTPSDWNNPDFVMTRNNISECKKVVNPLSSFITINQTKEEYDQNLIRLYVDKLRHKKGGQLIRIASYPETDRFYDHIRTIELFHSETNKAA